MYLIPAETWGNDESNSFGWFWKSQLSLLYFCRTIPISLGSVMEVSLAYCEVEWMSPCMSPSPVICPWTNTEHSQGLPSLLDTDSPWVQKLPWLLLRETNTSLALWPFYSRSLCWSYLAMGLTCCLLTQGVVTLEKLWVSISPLVQVLSFQQRRWSSANRGMVSF